jgi:hypothetical protein
MLRENFAPSITHFAFTCAHVAHCPNTTTSSSYMDVAITRPTHGVSVTTSCWMLQGCPQPSLAGLGRPVILSGLPRLRKLTADSLYAVSTQLLGGSSPWGCGSGVIDRRRRMCQGTLHHSSCLIQLYRHVYQHFILT